MLLNTVVLAVSCLKLCSLAALVRRLAGANKGDSSGWSLYNTGTEATQGLCLVGRLHEVNDAGLDSSLFTNTLWLLPVRNALIHVCVSPLT